MLLLVAGAEDVVLCGVAGFETALATGGLVTGAAGFAIGFEAEADATPLGAAIGAAVGAFGFLSRVSDLTGNWYQAGSSAFL